MKPLSPTAEATMQSPTFPMPSPKFSDSRNRRVAGFTLIELMVTVAIVAILAAIAYPSYRNYVIRGQLVDATSGLAALQANMERFYQDNRTYQTTGGFTSPCLVVGLTSGNFNLSCSTAPGVAPTLTAYTAAAIGQTGTNAAGFTFTVDNFNNKATTVAPPAPSSFSGGPCWISKTGGC